jgi:hypothetical protein
VAVTFAGTLAVRSAGNGAADHAAAPARSAAAVTPVAAASSAPPPELSMGPAADAAALRARPARTANAASTEEATKASATISVTSDLPARVTIDGAPAGTTPLRGLKRAPGRHVVGLVSIELDERLSATVDAKAGTGLAVHAEFTRPVPMLRVR